MNPTNEYSLEELAIIREIYASPETVESQAHRLPRRTQDSIEAKAHAMGLVKFRAKTLREQIHDLMADGKPRTIREVEAVIGGRRKYIGEQLRLASNGIDYHIHEFRGIHRCYVFKAGPGKNAVMPPPAHTPAKVYSARWRARHRDDEAIEARKKAKAPAKPQRPVFAKPLPIVKKAAQPVYDPAAERAKDQKYRLPATRWPVVDNALFDAMSAMARLGRQSA